MDRIDELSWLLDKISTSEDFLDRAEAYFHERSHEWSDGVAIQIELFLERKRQQVYCEQNLVERIGWDIALERQSRGDA
jgi:hypothetical protein